MADQPYSGPEVDAAVRILREDAAATRDRQLMARLDAMDKRLDRMPVKEMTPEEKAAEYDRLMAAGGNGRPPGAPAGSPGPGDGAPGPGQPPAGKTDPAAPPPAPAAKPPTPPTEQVSKSWWDGYQNRGA